ncbi:retrovirus-related Pol polyprotein from transposon 17.6 [Trichonephila clavipes]|nr:retrovirus-related Pol polyprotein from transposon 17.6 [Trichonephila clavipes]
MADLKDLKGALVFAMKFEAAQQATRKDRHPIRAVNESDTSNSSVERLERQMRSFMNRVESLMSQKADGKKTLKCWTCGREGHLQRSCRARQGAETNKRLPEGGVGKLINGHLVGRRLPDFGKPHIPVCQISTKSTGENGIFIMGHVNELPCNMIIDTGANVSIIRNDLAQKLKEKLIWTPPRMVLQTVTGEKIDIHGKLKVKIQFGDTTYQHAVYVADIADPFILGLDFLKEHGFTLDFNKNELRSIYEEVTIFKIEHRTESIRQSSNVCLQKFELALSNSPQQLTPDLLENVELSPLEQKSSAERLFQEFEDVFSRNSSDIGHTTVTQHRIDTADHPPIKQHPRRLPFAKQEEVGTLLREMQENDIIEPSSSPWASPIVLVRKKDGSTRFCVDYRKLNDVTKKDSYPLPRIDDTLDTLSGHKWFLTLDLKSGYWQVEVHPEDREKTAFTSGQGLWQFKVMPFGLCNAPATFECLMETVLKGLTFEACLIYLDDVIIGGRTFEEHLQNIRKVLSKLSDANLKLNPSKCKFFQKEVNYLGHIISAEGVRTDPKKVFAVKNWKRPENLCELRSFLGLCTYYRKFVKGFSNIARPLHKLTESKQKFQWTKDCEDSFLQLKEALTSSPILIYPQPDKPFILDTDASNESVGAVLSQEIDGQERVVAYWSSSHGNADALSRRPCPENCRHCSRVETKYDYAIRQITTSTATPPDPWSDEKVREDQMADPDIKPLIEFMESSSNKPSWQDISAYSPTTKQYWALWNSLHLRNGVLYRKFESEDGKTFRWQLVLPRSRIPEVLKELHGSPTGGHFAS